MTASSSKSTAVAKETLAYCTSCKMDLNHRIVAMKGDQIAKVECLTCRKEHVYKAAKGVNDPKKAPKPRKKAASDDSSKSAPVEQEWQKLMLQHREKPMKAYSLKGNFDLGDKISHPKFGEGIISRLIYPNKVEVIFQMDVKVMIHGGPAQA